MFVHRNNIMLRRCIIKSDFSSFVPEYSSPTETDILNVKAFCNYSQHMLVLTGAGISTESGIPDYRSKGVGLYETSSRRPITYQEFRNNAERRKRYWLRNYIGWPKFSNIKPNITHITLTAMEKLQKLTCIITQNVDRLHSKAGSKCIIELHGSSFIVICMDCKYSVDRHIFQKALDELNPDVRITTFNVQPDGDVNISQDLESSFNIPSCPNCGGILKPDVIFFGDNVPKQRVDHVKSEVERCDSLLILGSSVSTFSAYRIVLQASKLSKPICIINIGDTRADHLAKLKIDTRCGQIIPNIIH